MSDRRLEVFAAVDAYREWIIKATLRAVDSEHQSILECFGYEGLPNSPNCEKIRELRAELTAARAARRSVSEGARDE